METKSKRHVLIIGEIEGNHPKPLKSLNTRRHTNFILDIPGTKPKEMGSMPLIAK